MATVGDRMITQVFFVRPAVAFGLVLAISGFGADGAVAQSTTEQLKQTANQVPATTTAPAVAVLSPEAAALKTALEQRLGRNSTAIAGYSARAYQPIWTNADGSIAETGRILLDVLAKAADHALPAEKYNAAGLSARAATAVAAG